MALCKTSRQVNTSEINSTMTSSVGTLRPVPSGLAHHGENTSGANIDQRMPGAYAEYAACMAGLAMKIPDDLSDTDAATIEPLAVGLGAWKTANPPPRSDVLVIGAGVIGLAVAKWAGFFGAGSVGISELLAARLNRARKIGADAVIDAAQCADPVAEFERQTGRKPIFIFECVGRPMIARLIEIAPIGAQDFPFVQRMLSARRITVDGLVTATVNLDQAASMFTLLGQPNDHCKVLITP